MDYNPTYCDLNILTAENCQTDSADANFQRSYYDSTMNGHDNDLTYLEPLFADELSYDPQSMTPLVPIDSTPTNLSISTVETTNFESISPEPLSIFSMSTMNFTAEIPSTSTTADFSATYESISPALTSIFSYPSSQETHRSTTIPSTSITNWTDSSTTAINPDDIMVVESVKNSKISKPRGRARKKIGKLDDGAEIEIVPCKICGDRSSGVHYGVITCEGCKGFFRRSLAATRPFKCGKQEECSVERTSRNRCQYCRWKKCIEAGMSRDTVKFGRMSKKQREKVEGEINLHKNLKSTAMMMGDNKPVDNAMRQESSFPIGHYASGVEDYGSHIGTSSGGSSSSSGYHVYDAVSPVSSSGYSSSHTPSPISTRPICSNLSAQAQSISTLCGNGHEVSSGDSGDPLVQAISAAHARTSTITPDQRNQLKSIPINAETLWQYNMMTKEQLWIAGAAEVTGILCKIVEFAKFIPDFMALSQADQITLLKEASMNVAIIRTMTQYDLDSHRILFRGAYIPASLIQSHDPIEKEFIRDFFTLIQELASFKLTETEIALYSSTVLTWPHRPSIKDNLAVQTIHQRISDCLLKELYANRGDFAQARAIFDRLQSLISTLQQISARHVWLLTRFVEKSPAIELPLLYKELFLAKKN